MLNEKLSSYLSFGKRDRLGIIVLIFLIFATWLLPFLMQKKSGPAPFTPSAVLKAAMDTLSQRELRTMTPKSNRAQPTSFSESSLFKFDPNSLDAAGWIKLGLKEKTTRTIENYRSKGGRFKTKEDLKKIWGLSPQFYERVKDYIVIEAPSKEPAKNYFPKTVKEKKVLVVEVNDADTSAFIALPGIGSKLATRIINFRDKLGGFYSVDQVGETFGLQDSVFQKIKASLIVNGEVKKININTATKEELSMHPYIRWKLADAIIAYRKQHGSFTVLEELKNIMLVDELLFQKIVHYLVL